MNLGVTDIWVFGDSGGTKDQVSIVNIAQNFWKGRIRDKRDPGV